MSGFGLVSKVFGESLGVFRSALAGKGIHITDELLAKALKGLEVPTEGLSANLVHAQNGTFGVSAGYSGHRTKLSPLKPLVDISYRGERTAKTPEAIASELADMLDSAARQSNLGIVNSVTKGTSETASRLALAA